LAYKNKEWKTLIPYALIVILIIIIGLANLFFIGRSIVINPRYSPPALTLTYNKNSERKLESGIYETVFNITVSQPPGNFDTGFSIGNRVSGSECSKGEYVSSEQMTSGGISSSTSKYDIKCLSDKPIIDTKNLFFLGKTN